MLVISAGMQKSGSAYIYNLINEVLIASGGKDARELKNKTRLKDLLRGHNNNIGRMNNGLILRLLWSTFRQGSFAVKTHSGPSSMHSALIRLGLVRTIYIYRDPRDVLMSVQDHGRKVLAEGGEHVFTKMIEMDSTIANVRKWVRIFKAYRSDDRVLCIGYEDLVKDPSPIIKNICHHLKIDLSQGKISEIIKKYDRNNPKADMKGLHFNKAKAKRYKTELVQEDLDKIQRELDSEIKFMGYAIHDNKELESAGQPLKEA